MTNPISANGPEILFTARDRVDEARRLEIASRLQTGAGVTRYRRSSPRHGITAPNPSMDCYMTVIHVEPFPATAAWVNGKTLALGGAASGQMKLFDLADEWVTELSEPFHTINAFFPRSVFRELGYELGVPVSEMKPWKPGAVFEDPAMAFLSLSLQPSFDDDSGLSAFYVDHVYAAMTYHMAVTYGGLPAQDARKFALAPWHERRAKEFMLENLESNLSLADVAAICELSPSYFARAFKRATGMPPHRWVLQQRIERAKSLLLDTRKPLSEIALICGFSDQSHFSRVFTRLVRDKPGQWRRMRR